MTDALARIGERVLATCRSLTTVPLEVRFPGAALDVTADPALLVAQTWSALLPAPPAREPDPQAAFAAPELDDGAFAERDGGRSPAAFPNRFDGDGDAPESGVRGARRRIAETGRAPGTRARAASPGASPQRPSLAPDLSWWNGSPGVSNVTAAARSPLASRPLTDTLRTAGTGEDLRSPARSPLAPPHAASEPAASTRIAAEPPAAGDAARPRPSVSLVRSIRPAAPSAGPSATAASEAAAAAAAREAAAGSPRPWDLAASPSRPSGLSGTASGAAAPSGAGAYPVREPLAPPPAPGRIVPGATRMVRGTAGLASVLGAHLTAPGQPPPITAAPPAAAPLATAAAGNASPGPTAAGPASQVHAAGARAAEFLDAGGADAIYDALESRLRGEFLRTYGSYGS